MRVKSIITAALLAAFALTACEKTPQASGDKGELVINIGQASTRSAKDEDTMNSLKVWMFKDGKSQYKEVNPQAAQATVTFDNMARGEYDLYILANDPGSYGENSTEADLNAATLPALTDNRPPFSDDKPMPLSLIKKVSIGPGKNVIDAQLLRVCGRVRVTVRNKAEDKKVFISQLSLTDKNPSTGYLFPRDGAAPDGTQYGEFSNFENITGIEPGKEAQILDTYLYETGTVDAIGLSFTGGLFDKDYSGTPSVKVETVNRYGMEGSETDTTIDPGEEYFIASASNPRFFLGADADNELDIKQFGTDDELIFYSDATKYLWGFSSSSSSTQMQNFETKQYLTIPTDSNKVPSLTDTPSTISTGTNDGRYFYSYSSSGGRWPTYYYYYLSNNNGEPGISKSKSSTPGSTEKWYLRKATGASTVTIRTLEGAEKDIDVTRPFLTRINSYGSTDKITGISRNEDLNVVVNIYYSTKLGAFTFEVQGWTQKSTGTSFD